MNIEYCDSINLLFGAKFVLSFVIGNCRVRLINFRTYAVYSKRGDWFGEHVVIGRSLALGETFLHWYYSWKKNGNPFSPIGNEAKNRIWIWQ